jgi:predicted  nucleic acid-binding Zn-ribbon protein
VEESMNLMKEVADLRAVQAASVEQHKSMLRRIAANEELLKSLNDLAYSVRQMTERIEKMSKDIDDIKSKPAKRWESIVEKILLTAVGVFVGWALKQLGIF